MKGRHLLVVLVLGSLLLMSTTPVSGQSATTGGGFKVRVTEVDAGFGPESWKDEGAAAGDVTKTTGLPTGPVVYRNPYFEHGPHTSPTGPVNAWGYNVSVTLDLTDSRGGSIQDPSTNLFIEASIRTASGAIPAKLAKASPTRFTAQFDLDGEADAPWPVLLSGAYTIDVDVYRQDPGVQPEKVGTDAVPLTFSFGASDVATFPFPRSGLQVYSDLGNITPLHGQLLSPANPVSLTFSLGVPNAPARATVASDRDIRVVFTGTTDAAGDLQVAVDPAAILEDAAGGLLAVDAHLTGAGAVAEGTVTVGHGLTVLPVAERTTTITGITKEERSPSNASTDPSSLVRVTVWDPDATAQFAGRYGRAIVMDGTRVVENVPIPPAEPGSDVNHKFARFPAATIRDEGITSYTVYTFLFNERNEFYSLASATRGLSVTTTTPSLEAGGRTTLPVTVRNLATNGDDALDYGLALTAAITVSDLPGGGSWTGDVTVDEGTSVVVDVPVDVNRAGRYTVQVNATAAELALGRTFSLDVTEPAAGIRGVLQGLLEVPGPGLAGIVGLLGAAAVAARRRGL